MLLDNNYDKQTTVVSEFINHSYAQIVVSIAQQTNNHVVKSKTEQHMWNKDG